MATLGKMREYCTSSQEWPQYIEHLEFSHCEQSHRRRIEKDDTFVSDGTLKFKHQWKLITPVKPGDKRYAELVEVLTDHFSPKQSKLCRDLKSIVDQGNQVKISHRM